MPPQQPLASMHGWTEVHTSTFGLWNVYWEAVCKREQKQFVMLKFFVWCDLSHWVSLAISCLPGKEEGVATHSHIYGLSRCLKRWRICLPCGRPGFRPWWDMTEWLSQGVWVRHSSIIKSTLWLSYKLLQERDHTYFLPWFIYSVPKAVLYTKMLHKYLPS